MRLGAMSGTKCGATSAGRCAMRWLATGLCLVGLACSRGDRSGTDAGEGADGGDAGAGEEGVAYTGDSVPAIPQYEPGTVNSGTPEVVDAGEVDADRTCCEVTFRITDEEPPEATGVLVGDGVFSTARALTRLDGGWSVHACVPLHEAANYSYAFTWPTDGTTGGPVEDGGFEAHSVRSSASECAYPDPFGNPLNFFAAVSDCASIDAGVGTLP